MTPPGAGPGPFEIPRMEAPPPGAIPPPNMIRPPDIDRGVYVPVAPADNKSSSRGTTLKVIGITMGILLLLGIVIAVVAVAIIKQQPARRPRSRSRRRYDDDDDDY
jgi:hypothetical protein